MSSKVFDWLKTDCQTERENKNRGFFSATVKHLKLFLSKQKQISNFVPAVFFLPFWGAYFVNNEYWSVFFFFFFYHNNNVLYILEEYTVHTVHDWPQEKKKYSVSSKILRNITVSIIAPTLLTLMFCWVLKTINNLF